MVDLEQKPDWRTSGGAVYTAADSLTSFQLQDVAAKPDDKLADIVLRAPLTLRAESGHPPIWTDSKQKRIRLVIDARSADVDTGTAVAEGLAADGTIEVLQETRIALDIGGVEELVILGRGPGRDIHGQPSVTRLRFSNRIVIDGNSLKRYTERDDPIVVFARKLEDHVVVWPKEC